MTTLTLEQLISKFEDCERQSKYEKHEIEVVYDFGGLCPTELRSWRGMYHELALGWCTREGLKDPKTIKDLLIELRSADGKTFEGYKGGEYQMGPTTPVYVDNWGCYTLTEILDVEFRGYVVVIHTGNTR